MIYLINPKRKGGQKMAKRRPPKGYSSWKAWMAHIRPKRGKRRNEPNPARRTSRKRAGRKRTNPRYGVTHRVYRRNPVRGALHNIPGRLFGGVVDAAELLAGKAVARTVPGLVKIDRDTTTGLIVQATAGAAAGIAAHMVNANLGKMVMAGGLSAPLESLIRRANIPVVSAALGDDEPVILSGYPGRELSGYAHPALAPATVEIGDPDEYEYQQQ